MNEGKEFARGISYLQQKPLAEILASINLDNIPLPSEEARKTILSKYPIFNLTGLGDEGVSKMVSMVQALSQRGKEVLTLIGSGNNKEALQLVEDIRTVDDPWKSYLTTPVKELMTFFQGDFAETSRALGIVDIPHAQEWLEFMIRTWGMEPEDFRPAEETQSQEWKSLVSSVKDFMQEKGMSQQLLVWPNPELFKRLYIPEEGALFRGTRGMTEESIKALLENGIESRLLTKFQGDVDEVRKHLSGRNVHEELEKHYQGAGKGELFWQSPDESPFVAFSKWREVPLWHASRGDKYRVVVELVPKFHIDTLGYHTLQTTPIDRRFEAEGILQMAFNIPVEQTGHVSFDHPFMYVKTDEVAFYPKVDPQDISKIHLLPSNLRTKGVTEEQKVIPFTSRPQRLS